ncbi:MAG: DUF4252 domain-containing protein [Prevotellaceae bacterium]|jgi:hypothetical protein|nr:DUF4252 domain-containing protein [Prevotellaceae bacterium]
MKKLVILLALLLATAQYGYAQTYTVDRLFKEFANADNVENVQLGGFTMFMAGMFSKTMGVKGIEVCSFENCTDRVKAQVREAIGKLKDSNYETMLRHNKEGEQVRILTRMKDDYISELVVIAVNKSVALVRLKGKIKPQDIDELTAEND